MQQNHTYIKLVDVKRDNEYCTQSYTIKAWLQFGQCMDDERNDVAHSQQANEYYNRALFSCLRKLWVEHVDGGTCYGNLGVVHCLLAALNQAKGCQDGTLIIRVKNLGIEVIQIMHSTSISQHLNTDCAQWRGWPKARQRDYDAILLESLVPDYVDITRSLVKTSGGFGFLW